MSAEITEERIAELERAAEYYIPKAFETHMKTALALCADWRARQPRVCDYCEGTGADPAENVLPCPACNGKGRKAAPCAKEPRNIEFMPAAAEALRLSSDSSEAVPYAVLPTGALESPKTEISSRGTVLAEEIRAAHQARSTPCSTCGQPRGRHHAETLACPVVWLGHAAFSDHNAFTP